MTLKQQSIEGVKSTATSNTVASLLTFTQLLVLTRLLTPSDFGLMGMINVILGLCSLFGDAGISSFIIHKQEELGDTLSGIFWINLGLASALCCVLWIGTPSVAQYYGERELRLLLPLAAPILVLNSLGQPFQGLLERDMRFAVLARLEIGSTAFGILLAIVLAAFGFGAVSFIGGAYANLGARTAGMVWAGRKLWRPRFPTLTGIGGTAMSFGSRLLGQRVANYVAANVDFFLIGSFLGAQPLGHYTLAYNIANLPSTRVNAVVSRVLFPTFARIQDDLPRLRKGYLRMQELTALVNFPLLFGMVVVAPLAIPLLFGPSWQPAVLLLQILSVVGMGRAISGTIGPLLLARGRTDLGFKWSLMVVAIQVPGLLAGVLMGGVVGAAIAFALLQTLYAFLNYPFLVRTLIGPSLREYLLAMCPALWMSFTMAAVAFATRSLLHELPKAVSLPLCVAIGGLVYVGLVWRMEKKQFTELAQLILPKRTVA
jgi:lipopolysaccharide exporter